jgi:5-methylcytosine-specific restriction endonuclease McrBC GTP-binding regulatory subunit McrB
MKTIQDYVKVLEYKHQIILSGPPGTGKTYTAKDIAEALIFGRTPSKDKKYQSEQLKTSEQYALVQFHPAYTYEDFVRGIVVKTDNEGKTVYSTRNKTLGEMAEKAIDSERRGNLALAQDQSSEARERFFRQQKLDSHFDKFVESISKELEEKEVYRLTNKTNITDVNNDYFSYQMPSLKRDNKEYHMLFSDIQKAYLDGNTTTKDIQENVNLTRSARCSLVSFYRPVLEKLIQFIEENENDTVFNEKAFEKKNYVLVIDEINRANLPAVLGELIYALEYRGEEVKSMYATDESPDDGSLVLPENLFIIGTMNTADRSTGQIDYAIRRRFAFIDVLPDENIIENKNAKNLFSGVSGLFKKYLANDFKQDDVMLGHSYFLAKNDAELQNKLDYEIKPLLKEYLKDGILSFPDSVIKDGKNPIDELAL